MESVPRTTRIAHPDSRIALRCIGLMVSILLLLPMALQAQWVHQTTFPDLNRHLPFCFVVGGKAYIGAGFNSSNVATVDNYAYDPVSNSWTTKAVPPFSARVGPFSFTIGNVGYVGSGSPNGGATVLNDFWSYDATTDQWTQRTPFPGLGRIEAATFVINGKAYVVGGISSTAQHINIWEYDPTIGVGGTWTQKASPPSGFIAGYNTGWSDGNHGYCGIGGFNSSGDNRFWRYHPPTDSWVELASLPLPLRTWTTSGTGLGTGTGFVGLGGFNSVSQTDFWSYDATADAWAQLPSLYTFPIALSNARTFRFGNDVYIGVGGKPQGGESRIWKFTGAVDDTAECLDFEGDTSTQNWYSFFVESVTIESDSTHGNVLELVDNDGGSFAVNNDDFDGDWLARSGAGCFCFDYKVDWNEQVGSDAGSTPKLSIYGGAPIVNAGDLASRVRAVFIGEPGPPFIPDNVWDRYCLPIDLCIDGQLPSNELGQWAIYDANGLLTGQAACDAWSALIVDVTGFVLYTDYNQQPSEIVSFDEFCWACTDDACASVTEESISCRVDAEGEIVYDYCATIENMSTGYIYSSLATMSGPSGITFVPNPNAQNFIFNTPVFPVAPGGSYQVCFEIHGGSAGDVVEMNNIMNTFQTGSSECIKCEIDESITLTECPIPTDCCPADFVHDFSGLRFSLANNGIGSLSGTMSAGSQPMQSVMVTLVSSHVNGAPVVGQIAGGTLGSSVGTVSPMHEIAFGTWAPCKDLSAGSPFTVALLLPQYFCPPPPKGQLNTIHCPERDSVCLRFQFVDCECRRCDTMICMAVTRNRGFIWHKFPDRRINGMDEKKSPQRQAAPGDALLSGIILSDTNGRLDIVFPEPLDETTDVTFVSMSIAPLDSTAYITNALADGIFFAATGKGYGSFESLPGDSLSVALSYNDLGDANAIDHMITIGYRIDGELYHDDIPVTFHRAGLTGGDIVVEDSSIPVDGARTIGLHLQNLNGANRPIDKLALTASSGVEIVAVGPTATYGAALLELGRTEGGRAVVGEDVSDFRIELQPGETLLPIYVTVRGGDASSVLTFTTIDADGNAITEGELQIPSSVIESDDDITAGGIIMESYPNPTNATSTLELYMPLTTRGVELTIVDATGRIVQQMLDDARLTGGTHLFVVDTSTLPNGTYLYVVRSEFGTVSHTMRIVR